MRSGLWAASYMAVSGDMLAVNGLINMVSGGGFAASTGFSVSSSSKFEGTGNDCAHLCVRRVTLMIRHQYRA